MDLRPGDVVFERGHGWISRAVRWATRGRHEPPTRVNHVGIIVDPRGPEGPEVVEALWRVVRRPLSRMSGEIEVWSRTVLGDSIRYEVAAAANRYVGRSYGWWKILAHLMDALLTKALGREVFLVRLLLRLDDYPICSWVVAWAWEGFPLFFPGEHAFGVPPETASPDDIHDYVTTPGHGWEIVLSLEAKT